MSERTPPTGAIRHAFTRCHPFSATTEIEDRMAEFDTWLASVKAEAWDEGHHAGRLNETYRDHTRNFWRTPPTNPYREQETP